VVVVTAARPTPAAPTAIKPPARARSPARRLKRAINLFLKEPPLGGFGCR
jgi:hypothetical protein